MMTFGSVDVTVDIETHYPREYLMEWRRLRVTCKIRGLLTATSQIIDWRMATGHSNDVDLRHMKRALENQDYVG